MGDEFYSLEMILIYLPGNTKVSWNYFQILDLLADEENQ